MIQREDERVIKAAGPLKNGASSGAPAEDRDVQAGTLLLENLLFGVFSVAEDYEVSG